MIRKIELKTNLKEKLNLAQSLERRVCRELRELQERIKQCRDCWDYIYKPNDNVVPLTEGEKTAKIMIITQNPRGDAWKKRYLIDERNKIGKKLARIFGVKSLDKKRFYWTHYANCCFDELENDKPKDKFRYVPKKRREYCSNKWLRKQIMLLGPTLIIIVGGYAASYFFPCMKNLKCVLGQQKWSSKGKEYECWVIYHPSSINPYKNSEDLIKQLHLRIRLIQTHF